MAITLYSNVGTDQDIKDAMKANGVEPAADETPKVTEVKTDDKKTEPKVEPGADGAAETKAKPAPDSDPEDKPSQEESQETKEKAKGGWQRKVEKLTAQSERLREEVEAERGDKAKLREQLEEVNRRLAELSPVSEKKEAGPVKPERPELPDHSDFEYDAEGYKAAMKKYRDDLKVYDEKLDSYQEAMAEKKANEVIARNSEQQAKESSQRESERLYNEYVDRVKKDKEAYSDLDELLESIPKGATDIFADVDKQPSHAHAYLVLKSKAPRALLEFFARDMVENDSKESDRLAAMDPVDLVLELNAIERRLAGEREKKSKKEAPASAAAETPNPEKKETPPAQPQKKIAKTPDAPLEPVGGNAVPVSGDLNAQMAAAAARNDSKEFRRLLTLQTEQNRQLRS